MGAAAALFLMPGAGAQDVPALKDFLANCSRDSSECRLRLKDYVTAANAQKSLCLPKDGSVREAGSEILRWLRSDAAAALTDKPYDDALYEASLKLYPCAPAPAPDAAAPATPPQS